MTDSIFSDLTDKELEEILKLSENVIFESGQEIFKQGDSGDALYIIKEGTISLSKKNNMGEELKMGSAEQGMFLGELAILDGNPQAFSAKASTTCTTLKISKQKLDVLKKINKKLLCKFFISIIRYVNYRLRKANENFAASRSNMQRI